MDFGTIKGTCRSMSMRPSIKAGIANVVFAVGGCRAAPRTDRRRPGCYRRKAAHGDIAFALPGRAFTRRYRGNRAGNSACLVGAAGRHAPHAAGHICGAHDAACVGPSSDAPAARRGPTVPPTAASGADRCQADAADYAKPADPRGKVDVMLAADLATDSKAPAQRRKLHPANHSERHELVALCYIIFDTPTHTPLLSMT